MRPSEALGLQSQLSQQAWTLPYRRPHLATAPCTFQPVTHLYPQMKGLKHGECAKSDYAEEQHAKTTIMPCLGIDSKCTAVPSGIPGRAHEFEGLGPMCSCKARSTVPTSACGSVSRTPCASINTTSRLLTATCNSKSSLDYSFQFHFILQATVQ